MYEFSVPSKRELGTWMWLSYFILFFLGKKEKGKKKKKQVGGMVKKVQWLLKSHFFSQTEKTYHLQLSHWILL